MLPFLPRATAMWQLAVPLLATLIHGTSCSPGKIPGLGAVASEDSRCSRIGIDLLAAGGNAADALVGTVFCVGVVDMHHSGIGGGGFMLVRAPNGSYEFIDFREVAPAAAYENMFTNNTDASLYGGLASGVPGELRGLEYVHRTYGVLPWSRVMAPAIKLSRHGFRVTEDLVTAMDYGTPDGSFLTDDPSWAVDFAPHGYRVQVNDTMFRREYADTLESIARDGPDAFYSGPIAESTIAALAKANGTMTLDDLYNYQVVIRKPSEINYRGYKLTGCGAPSSGSVVLSALNTVNGFEGFGDPEQVNLTTHRLDEAIRFGYGQRTNFGDPSFVPGLLEYQESILSETAAVETRSKISDSSTHNVSYYNPDGIESLETPGTSHVTTADKSGLAITLTTTINTLFGSQIRVPETGIIMNNEMNDFSIPGSSNEYGYIPSPNNYVRPGKRPLSSISPIIAETPDGKLYLVVGAAGGSRIITSTTQNIHHVIDQNMTTPAALAEPRFHDQLVPDQVEFEYEFPNSTVDFMKSLGHNVTWVPPGTSLAQAVRLLPNGTFEAAAEPRLVNSGGFSI